MNTLISAWHKKQAALLYHFSSVDYLREILNRLNRLIKDIDGSLDEAKNDQRDMLLISERWGSRDTAANWGNNAWHFLADFQQSLARNISNRAFEIYSPASFDYCARGLDEFSTVWMGSDRQAHFDKEFAELSTVCYNLNNSVDKTWPDSLWKDFTFAVVWRELRNEFPCIPKFQLRTDITCATGMRPPRTGVYIPLNDPYGAAQFGWTGDERGKLLNCQTFNQLGQDAFNQVGRARLWLDDRAMYTFATLARHNGRFDQELTVVDTVHPNLAPSAIAREAFTAVPREWCYVELINGEFEDPDDFPAPEAAFENARVNGGDTCRQAGFYFTPVSANSRRFFNAGELMPELANPMGKTIWQWDERQ